MLLPRQLDSQLHLHIGRPTVTDPTTMSLHPLCYIRGDVGEILMLPPTYEMTEDSAPYWQVHLVEGQGIAPPEDVLEKHWYLLLGWAALLALEGQVNITLRFLGRGEGSCGSHRLLAVCIRGEQAWVAHALFTIFTPFVLQLFLPYRPAANAELLSVHQVRVATACTASPSESFIAHSLNDLSTVFPKSQWHTAYTVCELPAYRSATGAVFGMQVSLTLY